MEKTTTDNIDVRIKIARSLEHSLTTLAHTKLEELKQRLESRNFIYFLDCFDNPNILKTELQSLFPDNYSKIIESMEKWLGDLLAQKPYSEFFEFMRK